MSGGPAERVLVVDYRVPHFDQGGGDPRMDLILHCLRELWPGLSLTLAVPCADGAETYGGRLRDAGVEVVHGQADWASWFAGRRFHYGIVLASRTREFEPHIRRTQPQALRVLDVEALFFRRLEQLAAREGARDHRSEAARVRAEEVAAIREADVVWCVSEEEKVFVESVAPATPSCFVRYAAGDGPAAPGFSSRRGLVFLGSFIAGEGSPNEDAALNLVGEVMPRLWRERPGLPLTIVGARPTPKVRALQGDPVEVVGYVPDPRVLLSAARVLVAPIRVGAGVKLKLVESMAAGLPFVTTPRGAEGLGLGALAEHLVGDDADGIAARVLRLYDDLDLWERVRAELAAVYVRRFSPRAFREDLVDAMAWAGVAPP